ncbi:outer membrane beta-barrel family protein [Pedobacter panaciterrae]|uniref:Outer membrane beta-barrel family protein n=1 Tax=Pedobacter panaciterrae TaxID=363849 RepID=A0ABU8NTW2_9SPHI|nr:outer membrane beta-barrel family protein [uncultured Pedobacter sp.]
MFEITGQLSNLKPDQLSGISVNLIKAETKKLVKIEFPDTAGKFIFNQIEKGNYHVVVKSLAFKNYESNLIVLTQNFNLGDLHLVAKVHALDEVNIVGNKPFIQQQHDKTVLNVASSIAATGSNALDLLSKAPGVNVDPSENISMRGKPGVLVMVDGKLLPISGQELSTILKSISGDQIDRIELITSPSAKYDASGNSGIIDIRLKKGLKEGLNGNLAVSFGQGVYNKVNPSANVNLKIGKLNLFGSYTYSLNNDFVDLAMQRFFSAAGTITGGNSYQNYFKMNMNNHNVRLGGDLNISENVIVGFIANGIFIAGELGSNSKAQSFDANQNSTGYFNTTGILQPVRNNESINFNYKHTLDKEGQSISLDLDYADYGAIGLQDYLTTYSDNNGIKNKDDYILHGDLNGDLKIKSFKSDYSKKLKSLDIKLDLGLKSSFVTTKDNIAFYNLVNKTSTLDVDKSNNFNYKEWINAIYINASKKWEKINAQFGLRLERTQAEGIQLTNLSQFERKYLQLFPSIQFGYNLSKVHELNIALTRRINRPTYQQLNPFKVFLDPLTSSTGNPLLNPEITTSFELSHTWGGKYLTKFGYSITTDKILSILSPDVKPSSIIQTGRNLARYDYYTLSFSAPITIGKWLTSNVNALVYYGKYSGNIANTDIGNNRVTFSLTSTNMITFNSNTSLEINGKYDSRRYYGIMDIKPTWYTGLAIQRQILAKKASLKLNITDVFYTRKTNASNILTGYTEFFRQKGDSRVGTFSFSYKFGSNKSSNTKKQTGGAEDEKRRAN